MSTWQFVDSIASSPTVRLDLHSAAGGLMLAGDPEVSPPRRRRVTTSSMLADGELVPAAAYDNRIIRMTIQVVNQSTTDLAAAKLQLLARELTRQPGNFLRVTVGTNAMFFRTLPAPDAAYQLLLDAPQWGSTTLEIPCEPFGYGLKETLTPVTVTNNPAAGANGMFLDVTSPKGDVETPLDLKFATGTHGLGATGRLRMGIAVRRRGTVSATPLALQAESMTMGTDTAVQVTSASFSGASNNYVKTTPGTTAMTTRLSTTTRFPTSASVDARGTYRVFARVRQNTNTDVWDMRLTWGATGTLITGDTVRLPNPSSGASIFYVDLTPGQKLLQIPVGYDPVYDGLTGVELAAEGVFLSLQAQRVSGSGTLDTDLLLFMPADDRMEFIKWPTTQTFTTDTFHAVGGPRPAAYCLNTSGQLSSVESIETDGGGMMITPGRTNRVFIARDLGTGTATTASGTGDNVAATMIVTPSYHPRYLYPLRPTGT